MLRAAIFIFVALQVATSFALGDQVFSKFPELITVDTHVYKISFPALPDNNPELDGVCSYLKTKEVDPFSIFHYIEVRKDLPKSDKESTLIHEVLHAISHEYNVFLNEEQVLALESALYKTFKKNNWEIKIPK